MKVIKIFSALVIIVVAGGWLVVKSMTVHIPMGKVGVRIQQYNVFGRKGVVAEDFGPGWHRDLGPIDNWQMYDSTVQTLEMTRNPMHGARLGRDDVKVTSADGYAVSLDVTVKFRLMNGKAHELYQDTGSGTKYMTIVRNEAESACMGRFGQMSTEDFYNPVEKRKAAAEVKQLLAQQLQDNAVEIIDVLVRDVQFDPEYENKIRRKKLADQEVELNKSEAKAEQMSGKTQVIEAETKKLVDIIVQEKKAELITMRAKTDLEIARVRAEFEKYATQKRADADLIAAQRHAEGVRLTKQAEAEGERRRNEALQGAGGSVIVALEAARNLNLDDVTISTLSVDLLDVDAMSTRLGLKK